MSNATLANDRNALFITYNNLTMANIMPNQDLTIDCANNKLGTDITIVCLEDRIVAYGGKRTNISAGKTAVLKCGGKKMVGDIEVLVINRGDEDEDVLTEEQIQALESILISHEDINNVTITYDDEVLDFEIKYENEELIIYNNMEQVSFRINKNKELEVAY